MNKKSQATILIILGIIIVVIVGVIFSLKYYTIQNNEKNYLALLEEIKYVEFNVKNCIKDVSEDSLIIIGSSGGYYEHINNVRNYEGVAYFYEEGEYYVNNKNIIEKEISNYIEKNLRECTTPLFINQGFKIKDNQPKINTKIQDNSVIINANYKIKITKGEVSYELKEFGDSINVRLGNIENYYNEILNNEINFINGLCLNCINDLSVKYNLYLETTNYEEDTILFTIIDLNSTIKNDNYYEFRFMIKI